MIRKILEIFMIYSLCSLLAVSAEFTFKEKLVAVTTKPDVEVVNVEFDFQNNTDQVISIVNFNAPCSCLNVRLRREDKKESLVFEPGTKGTVIGVLEFGSFKGTIDKVIEIRTDQDEGKKPSIVLTCRVTIPVLIAPDKQQLNWEVGAELQPQEFMIKVAEESETLIKIADHKAGYGVSENFDYKLETVTDGREYKVTVTPLNTKEPSIGVIKFYTDSKIQRYKVVQIYLLVDHPKK